MSSSLAKLGSWFARKAVISVVVAAASFGIIGLWLFVHDTNDYTSTRDELVVRRDVLRMTADILGQESAKVDAVVAREEQRAALADRIIKELKGIDNLWDRFVANPVQQEANAAQLEQTKVLKKTIAANLVQLRHAQIVVEGELSRAEARLAQTDATLSDREHGFSPVWHYVRETWRLGRRYIGIAVAAYLLGPTLVCLGFYYLLAPLVTRGRPLRLVDGQAATVTAAASQQTAEIDVWPGEVLLARKKFISSVDAALTRKTRTVLSWWSPFSSLACGLTYLAAVRNARSTGGHRVVFEGKGKTMPPQFTVVDVPEGGSLVVRMGLLAGVLCPSGQALVMRSHFRLFYWQAWVAGQFRSLEFTGPCRIVLATCQALKAEALVPAEVAVPATRVRQEAIVGFTPNLECRPVRAVSFWRYYIGATLLFEAGFSGPGLVIHAANEGRLGAGAVRRRLLKLFGL